MRLLAIVTAILALTATSANSQSDLGDVGLGHDLARKVCAECHRVEKGQTGRKFVAVTAFQVLANNPAKTALSLRVFLKTPHRNMPDFLLTEAEIDSVIAYIHSLK